MVLIINDMVTFSNLGKHRYGHWMLFICNVGRVYRGTTFIASEGQRGRLGQGLTELNVSIIVST